jgi:hypothetical protein
MTSSTARSRAGGRVGGTTIGLVYLHFGHGLTNRAKPPWQTAIDLGIASTAYLNRNRFGDTQTAAQITVVNCG